MLRDETHKKGIRHNLMPKNLLSDMLPHGLYPAFTTSLAAPPSEPNCCLSTLSWEVKEHNPPVFLYRIYHVSAHLSRTFSGSTRAAGVARQPANTLIHVSLFEDKHEAAILTRPIKASRS